MARASLALALTTPAALGLGQGRTVASAPSHAGDAGSDADAKTAPGGDAGSDAHASATVGRSCPAGPPPRLPVRYSGFAREGYSYSREHPESVHGQVHHVRGALGASALEEVTGRYLGRFRLCYWSALRTHPNLAGRVAVVLAVGPDGAVVSAERDAKHTTLPSDAAVTCVLDHLRSVSFPAAERAAPTDACVDVDLYP